jgi:glycerol-3-phosphate acyltransferase PlsY
MLIGDLLIAATIGYVFGAFPTGVLVTRVLRRPDVRHSGSGHTGGLNSYRQAGLPGGLGTALVDVGKGVLAAWLALKLTGTMWAVTAAGVAAVAGHCWSVYIGFRGGMGIGTLAGLFWWLLPITPFIAAGLWGLLYLLIRDSPRAVMLMAILMVLVFLAFGRLGYATPEVMVLGIGGLGVIFVRHLTQLGEYQRRMEVA